MVGRALIALALLGCVEKVAPSTSVAIEIDAPASGVSMRSLTVAVAVEGRPPIERAVPASEFPVSLPARLLVILPDETLGVTATATALDDGGQRYHAADATRSAPRQQQTLILRLEGEMSPPPDLDMTKPPDGPDLGEPPDLMEVPDLVWPSDLTEVPDLVWPPDLTPPADLVEVPDITEIPDLVPPPPPNYMFVTSKTYTPGSGPLGGLAQADAECLALGEATTKFRGRTWRAFLSDASTSAKNRLGQARGWLRPDDRPFAGTVTALFDQFQVFYPPRLDEAGADRGAVVVATGSTQSGTRNLDCTGWTTSAGMVSAGRADAGSYIWTYLSDVACSTPLRFYCFSVDYQHTLGSITPPAQRRYAFVSDRSFATDQGINDADQACGIEASNGGLPGSYKALLATSSATAASRFNLGGYPWVRVDGIPLAATPSDVMAGNLAAALNVMANGTYGGQSAITGAPSPTLLATNNCGNWTSTGATAQFGQMALTTVEFFGRPAFANYSCSWPTGMGHRVYCLQE